MTEKVIVSPTARQSLHKIQPGINAKERTWTSLTGMTFKLLRVSWAASERIINNPKGRPVVPMATVHYGEVTGQEPNPNDDEYLAKMAEWRADNSYRAMIYVFGTGVDLKIPSEFRESQKEFFPEASENEIRYLYVTSLIDPNEFDGLMKAILGQTGITENGISDAESSFPGDGKR